MSETRHPHWRVSIETSGELIVAIEPEMLAGREISEADEDAIRTAAHHLLAFIGDPAPADRLDGDGEAAIALGAAVLTRIKDPSAREIAIRNALTVASKGLAVVPQGALPVRASEQAKIDAYKAASPPPVKGDASTTTPRTDTTQEGRN